MTSPNFEDFTYLGTIRPSDIQTFVRSINQGDIMPDSYSIDAPDTTTESYAVLAQRVAQLEAESSRLREANRNLTSNNEAQARRWNNAQRKVVNLLQELYEMEDDSVEQLLSDNDVPGPNRVYRFTYRVHGTVSQEFVGRNEDEAWENADTNNFNTYDVDDLEDAGDDYTDSDLVRTEPISMTDVANWLGN